MREIFKKHSEELAATAGRLDDYYIQVEQVVKQLKAVFMAGNKVLIAGNGGSAAEAQHFTDEMVGRYKEDRPGYPAIALTADSMVVTCIGNDYGYENLFKRQVEALGKEGDIFIGLTTSGTSKNILAAAEEARRRGMTVVAFMGLEGKFRDIADYVISSPSAKAAIVQEFHLHAIHLICEAFEPGL